MPVIHVETRDVVLADLTPFPGNARRGDIPKIRESVRRLGQYRSLIVRDTGRALVILAGNNTFQALQAEGWATARCEIVRCGDDEASRINVVDNRLPDLGDYDPVALAAQLASFDGDLDGIGYNSEDLHLLMSQINQELPVGFEHFAVKPIEDVTRDLWPQQETRPAAPAAPAPASAAPTSAPTGAPAPAYAPATPSEAPEQSAYTSPQAGQRPLQMCPSCGHTW